MDLKVKEATTSLELSDLIRLLNENTHYEHDCSREVYINHVVKNMYKSTNHRITLLYSDDDEAVGYLIVQFSNYLNKEIEVLDIFIVKKHQGKKCMDILVNDLIPIAFNVKALRIKWPSYVFDTDFWETHSFGTEVKNYKIFYVELTKGNQDIYNEVIK